MNPFRILQSLLNRLLPFTRPGTPLLQDLVHTVALCAFLYFAPVIFENRSLGSQQQRPLADDATATDNGQHEDNQHIRPAADRNAAAPALPNDGAEQFEDGDFIDDDDDAELAAEEEEAFAAIEAARAVGDAPPQPGADPAAAAAAAQHRRAAAAATRQVGAKKARSLARRDQRRAYHEFVRTQAEAQRAREREGAEEREAELFEEKRRRAVAEAAVEERARREREERRERERRAREEEGRVQREALKVVREGLEGRGAVGVEEVLRRVGRRAGGEGEDGDGGREWLERLLRADGVVGRTAGGWVVRVRESDMQDAWRRAAAQVKSDAKITFADLGEALEELLRNRA
ncbi:hypothetical protein BFW01_g10043 [Lasiodiplodia theobromae]|nr:hypothetical protein BFW01_g10043 [Lasiodiplodia theobromae]